MNLKLLSAILFAAVLLTSCQNPKPYFGTYITGDFHQHTAFTDGSLSMPYVMQKEDSVGLDWWVNSEHGGGGIKNGLVSGMDVKGGTEVFWDSYIPDPILGKRVMVASSGDHSRGHSVMWRWQR